MSERITPQDFLDTPTERIFGTEMELLTGKGFEFSLPASAYEAAGIAVCEKERYWFSNGGCIYGDVCHAEYDTPEAQGLVDATAAAMAGLKLVQTTHKAGGQTATIHHHAASYAPNSAGKWKRAGRGFHLNAMAPEIIRDEPILTNSLLSTAFATETWAGAGYLGPDGFEISQKADDIGVPVGERGDLTTPGKKPIAFILAADHTYNHDIIDKGWTRIERRDIDAIRSAVVLFVRFATTSIYARLTEHIGLFPEISSLFLRNPVTTMWRASKDLTLRQTYTCWDGKKRTTTNIQEGLYEYAEELDEKIGLPEQERAALPYWGLLLDTMRQSNPLKGGIEAASEVMDWAFRQRFLQRKRPDTPIEKLNAHDRQLNKLSLGLDLIYPYDALGNFPGKKDGFALRTARLIKEYDIVGRAEHLMRHAPDNTRAAIRGALVTHFPKSVISLGWRVMVTKFNEHNITPIHPHQSDIPTTLIPARLQKRKLQNQEAPAYGNPASSNS